MANRRARVVRSVKVNGKWKFLSLEKGRKLKIPNEQGRWYVTWREGSLKRWKRAADYGAAHTLQVKKDTELHAKALGLIFLIVFCALCG